MTRLRRVLRGLRPRYWKWGNKSGKLSRLNMSVPMDYDEEAALMFPAVVRCIQLVSERAAALPMVVEQARGDEWEPVNPEDPEAVVVSKQWLPNETSATGRMMWMDSIMRFGWGVVLVEREGEGGRLSGLRLLNPDADLTRTAEAGVVVIKKNNVALERGDLAVIDWKPPLDRVEVVPPLAACWPAVRAGIAADSWAGAYFADGATGTLFFMHRPDPAVVIAGKAGTKKLLEADLEKSEKEMRLGNRRSMLLPDATDVKAIASNVKDADVGNIILSATRAVCDVFGVPSQLLSDPKASTYNNVSQAGIDFARGTMSAWARRIAEELSLAIWPLGNRRVRFDLEKVTAEARRDRVYPTIALVNAGIISPNEARLSEDYETRGPEYDELRDPTGGEAQSSNTG